MVTVYFEKAKVGLGQAAAEVENCTEFCEEKVKAALCSGKTVLGSSQIDLQLAMQDLKRRLNFDIEEVLRQDRLREARRFEEELKQKLESVQEDIQSMTIADEPKPARLRFASREVRTAVQQAEDAKIREARLLALKMREEQKKARRTQAATVARIKMQEEQKAKIAEQCKQQEAEELERRKQERVATLKELNLQRKSRLSKMQDIVKHSKVRKLTSSLSESPKHHHSFSEAGRIRIGEAIREHCNHYSDVKRSLEAKRIQQWALRKATKSARPYKRMHYFHDVIAEERAAQQEEQEKAKLQIKLLEKKKQYSELVKEMHIPSVARIKQLELERLIAKLHTLPRLCRPVDRSARPQSIAHSPDRARRKRTEASEERPAKPIDYLPSVRRAPSDCGQALSLLTSELTELSPEPSLLEKAHSLERKALRHAQELRLSDPRSFRRLIGEIAVDDALLSSVKAKFKLLSC